VPLSKPSKDIHSAGFSAPSGRADGGYNRQVVLVQDLSVFVNTLIFTCSTQPGLADVLLELMSFGDHALRLRKVVEFPDKGKSIIGVAFSDLWCHFEDAIVVGVVPSRPMTAAQVEDDNGMAPLNSSSRTIRWDDRLAFISESSCPKARRTLGHPLGSLGHRVSGRTPPGLHPEPPPFALDPEGDTALAHSDNHSPPLKLLVCGFKEEWKDTERFSLHINDAVSSLPEGSSILFLNMMECSEFEALMQEAADHDEDIVRGPDLTWLFLGTRDLRTSVTLSHRHGDAADYETLNATLQNASPVDFDVAIILPSVAPLLSAQAQDTRLMSIMCILRTIVVQRGLKMIHVVGENKLESTSRLALRPLHASSATGKVDDSDFVNAQAISARALCQALAYPDMQPALLQLLCASPGSPSVHLCSAGMFLPYGVEICFADVIRRVKKGNPDDICIGHRVQNERRMITQFPVLSDEQVFQDGDVLLIISRGKPQALGSSGASDARHGDGKRSDDLAPPLAPAASVGIHPRSDCPDMIPLMPVAPNTPCPRLPGVLPCTE